MILNSISVISGVEPSKVLSIILTITFHLFYLPAWKIKIKTNNKSLF